MNKEIPQPVKETWLNKALLDKEDPWVEIEDEYGRSRLVRKSQAGLVKGPVFVRGDSNAEEVVETNINTGNTRRGLMSEDMKREQERLDWEQAARREGRLFYFTLYICLLQNYKHKPNTAQNNHNTMIRQGK